MKKLRKLSKKITAPMVVLFFLLSGCRNVDEYKKERVAKADRAFKEIKSKDLPKDAVLSLPYCIHTALSNNLNIRIYDLKEAVNREQKTAAALGMLPDVIVTNDISYRTNQPGASSYNIATGEESLAPSQSAQDYENRVRVEFLFSFIDFGLAYFNAVQARDRTLITAEQKRRATQNLILDVSRAYFKVAAAQYAMENTERMLQIANQTESLLEEMVKNKKLPLEKVVIEKKTFLVLKKSLMEYKRSYENSCIELRSLMGYYPNHEIVVDTSGMKKIADLKIPDIELLEEIALLERPELYQLDIQHHITAVAARKKVVEMFPNVGIFTDFTNSTNKYLYNQSWWELGARAAYRLLRVPQQIGEYVAIESEMEQIDVQVNALSVGILSQVRIAHANLVEVKQRYAIAEELYNTYLKHEIIKEKQAKTSGALSKIELNRIKMETAQKDIERTQALGNYYLAYFRLLNSVGLESLDSAIIENIKKRIHESFIENKDEEIEKIAEYKYQINELQISIDEYKNKLEKLNVEVAEKTKVVNQADNKKTTLQSELDKKQLEEQNKSAAIIDEFNKKIADNKTKLAAAKEQLDSLKPKYDESLKSFATAYRQKKTGLVEQRDTNKSSLEKVEKALEKYEDNFNDFVDDHNDHYENKIDDMKDMISDTQDQINELDRSINDERNELAELNEDKKSAEDSKDIDAQIIKVEKNINDYSVKLADLKSTLKTNTDKLSSLQNEQNEKLASHNNEYSVKKDNLTAELEKYKNNLAELNAQIEQAEQEYEKQIDNAEKEYDSSRKQLKIQVADLDDKNDIYCNSIEDEQDRINHALYNKQNNYIKQIDNLHSSEGDLQGEIKNGNELIAKYSAKLKDLESQKIAIEEQLNSCMDLINEHGDKLARYMTAIELLDTESNAESDLLPTTAELDELLNNDSNSDNETVKKPEQGEALAPPNQSGDEPVPGAVTPDDNMNMEAQTQSGNSSISFLEYSPEATKNINIQAENNAGNNDITLMGFNPETQNDVQMQSQSNAGNNEINFQEYGSNLNTGDDNIGSAPDDKAIDEQLGKSLTD